MGVGEGRVSSCTCQSLLVRELQVLGSGPGLAGRFRDQDACLPFPLPSPTANRAEGSSGTLTGNAWRGKQSVSFLPSAGSPSGSSEPLSWCHKPTDLPPHLQGEVRVGEVWLRPQEGPRCRRILECQNQRP